MLEKTLESPLTAGISNQSILKEINPEYSLEGLMLKLKLQYFGHLMQRTESSDKTLMLGNIEGRRRGQWRMKWLESIIDSMDMNLSRLLELVMDREGLHAAVHGVAELDMTEQLNWTELSAFHLICSIIMFFWGVFYLKTLFCFSFLFFPQLYQV